MPRQEGRKPTRLQACAQVLELDGQRYQCIRWPGSGDHRMFRNDRTALRLPHPIHESELGHEWLANGRVLTNPEGN